MNILGRKILWLSLLTAAIGAGLLVLIVSASDNKSSTSSCAQVGKTVTVTVDDDKIQPAPINAKLCERVVVTNKGQQTHQIAIGQHPTHYAYPGFIEKPLAPGESNSLILKKSGEFDFHDHLNPKIETHLAVE